MRALLGERAAGDSRLVAAGGFTIDLLVQTERDQALDERHVDQRPGEIAVPRVALLVLFDGAGEAPHGFFVAALAARDAAIGGLDVAAKHVIVALAEGRLGFLEDVRGLRQFALLEHQPALQRLHDRRHLLVAEIQRELFAAHRVAEGIVVAALVAQRAPDPEVGDGDHLLVADFAGHREHELEAPDRGSVFLVRHGDDTLGHAQVYIVGERQGGAGFLRKAAEEVPDEGEIGEAGIDPLGGVAEKRGGVLAGGIERFDQRAAGGEVGHAAADAAKRQVLAQALEEFAGYRGRGLNR